MFQFLNSGVILNRKSIGKRTKRNQKYGTCKTLVVIKLDLGKQTDATPHAIRYRKSTPAKYIMEMCNFD